MKTGKRRVLFGVAEVRRKPRVRHPFRRLDHRKAGWRIYHGDGQAPGGDRVDPGRRGPPGRKGERGPFPAKPARRQASPAAAIAEDALRLLD